MSILYAIQNLHNSILDKIMIFLSTLGDNGYIWIAMAVLLLAVKEYKKCSFAILLSLIFSLLICNVLLKNMIVRSRPCWEDPSIILLISIPKDFSFPSGHTSSSFAAATVLYYNNKKIGIIAYILAALIAFSRLYLFVHYPSDILGGIFTGIISALFAIKIINFYSSKRVST